MYPQRGRGAINPVVLSIVTILQYFEDLPDRATAKMSVARLDWLFALRQQLGHKTQVTETVDGDIRIISDIDIRSAIESDGDALGAIYERLDERGLLPNAQFVD